MTSRDIEDILKDVRKDKLFSPLTSEEKAKWESNPEVRSNLYLREKAIMSIDVERWPLAIESYKKYGCFSFVKDPTPGKYFVNDDLFVCYCKGNEDIVRLQADVLTNDSTIKKVIEKHELSYDEDNLVKTFYKVAYTIGNFSLIWKNIGGRGAVMDTCWNKLENSGIYNENGELQELQDGLEERKNIDNFMLRTKENLFMILPEKQDPKEVIKKLYFQDYFDIDNNWNLRWPNERVDTLEKEVLLKFIKKLIILIVQRSYRIICNCTDYWLTTKDQSNIKAVLCEIGLVGVNCICSQKMS